jgi:CBS domain-containing protein
MPAKRESRGGGHANVASRLRRAAVVDSRGHVVGMITDRDICIAVASRGRTAERISVHEVSTGQLVAVAPDDDVQNALTLMKTHQIRRLPVIDASGALIGIVSMNDIVLHASGRSGLPPTAIVDALKGICAHRSIKVA